MSEKKYYDDSKQQRYGYNRSSQSGSSSGRSNKYSKRNGYGTSSNDRNSQQSTNYNCYSDSYWAGKNTGPAGHKSSNPYANYKKINYYKPQNNSTGWFSFLNPEESVFNGHVSNKEFEAHPASSYLIVINAIIIMVSILIWKIDNTSIVSYHRDRCIRKSFNYVIMALPFFILLEIAIYKKLFAYATTLAPKVIVTFAISVISGLMALGFTSNLAVELINHRLSNAPFIERYVILTRKHHYTTTTNKGNRTHHYDFYLSPWRPEYNQEVRFNVSEKDFDKAQATDIIKIRTKMGYFEYELISNKFEKIENKEFHKKLSFPVTERDYNMAKNEYMDELLR